MQRPPPPSATRKTHFEQSVEKARALANERVKGIVLTRSLDAIMKYVEFADADELAEVANAPTNYEVLRRQLSGGLDLLRSGDPLADARLRGLGMKEALLKKVGGALTAAEAAALLGLTRQGIDKRRRARRLLAISFGKRGYLYPAFQFEERLRQPIQEVLTKLDERIADWALLAFFVNGNAHLGGKTPVQALEQGKATEVLRAAENYGVHGAA